MECREWSILSREAPEENRYGREALFTVGNGYFGIRGFFEEDAEALGKSGGIYMAGVFGAGTYDAWEGRSRELCNTVNFLQLRLTAGGERIDGVKGVSGLVRELHMDIGVYRREYRWTGEKGESLFLSFERFADKSHAHRAGQRIVMRAEDRPVSIAAELLLDGDVTNLNLESCEPLPIQPGRQHLREWRTDTDRLSAEVDGEDGVRLYVGAHVRACLGEKELELQPVTEERAAGRRLEVTLEPGACLVLEKIVYVAGTPEDTGEPERDVAAFLASPPAYRQVYAAHCDAWKRAWQDTDIAVETETEDAGVLRYNLFELQAACPPHTDRLGVGARGLTGEMYEGCVFWDNEIFQLPFFIYTDPPAAARQLLFRHHTLEAAKRHAVNNWFEGAMYPWQVSEKGIEQTPVGGGAYYAIHITADIAYAVSRYCRASGDDEFFLKAGAEILFETARFWSSRCQCREDGQTYEIRAVRGPNEYDVIVHNNAYTNCMAAENLRSAAAAYRRLQAEGTPQGTALIRRVGVTDGEAEGWERAAEGMLISMSPDGLLVEEDDGYFLRRPLDLKRAKPTSKRIIDSTLPYEALPYYQVTKQSDVVTLMGLLPERFTTAQMEAAYRYYEPRTAHDSSLSYAPHALLAARLGMLEEAYRYFRRSATLDIADRQLNTISGLHFANFGGTWQAVFFGFAGVCPQEDGVVVQPQLPAVWTGLRLHFYWHGNRVTLAIGAQKVSAELDRDASGPVKLTVFGKTAVLDREHPAARWEKGDTP